MRTKLEEADIIIKELVELTKKRDEATIAIHNLVLDCVGLDLTEEPADVREAREIQEFEEAVCELIQNGALGKNAKDELINGIKRIRRPRDD